MRCCDVVAVPSEDSDAPVGGDIGSTRGFPDIIELAVCDLGEGDCATRVICRSSVVLLPEAPPLPETKLTLELVDEGG